jgi:hypothetical protein
MRKLPAADPAVFALLKKTVAKFCAEKLTPLDHVPTCEEWLAGSPYPQHRRDELARADAMLCGAAPNRKQRMRVTSFVKAESYATVKHARMINSRSDACKVYMGPAVHAMEEQVFALPYFAKSFKKPGELVAHLQSAPKKAHWYASDYTAFESHMTPAVLEAVECAVYKYLLSETRPDLAEFMKRTLAGTNRCSTRSGVRYTVKGRRMSGDMQTSLGNSITNLCLALMVCHEAGDDDPFIIVEGDDALVGTNFPLDSQLWEKAGFTIKVEEVESATTAGFCGKIFGEAGQVIRDPIRFLQTFGWSEAAVGAGRKVSAQLLLAKALSAAFETPHCPIVRAVADAAIQACPGIRPRWIYDGYHSKPGHVPEFDPSPSTRVLFERKFGISPEAQILLEARIRSGEMTAMCDFTPITDAEIFYGAFVT